MKRSLPLFALCLLSLTLAACMSPAPPPAAPTVDVNTQLLWELRELRNHIDALKAAVTSSSVTSAPGEAPSPSAVIESISYTRKSGRILVVYSNKETGTAALTSATQPQAAPQ